MRRRGLVEADAKTRSARAWRGPDDPLLALHVSGPGGGARHPLTEQIVTVGRDSSSTVVVADARASRAHAMLEIGEAISLCDLGTTNGTFVGDDRLPPRQPRPIAIGQSFFIGDTALVIRRTSLRAAHPSVVSTFQEVRARFDHAPRMLVLRVRPRRPVSRAAWQAILGELLEGASDWSMWVGRDLLLAGMEIAADANLLHLEHAAREQLASWAAEGDLEAAVVSRQTLDELEAALRDRAPDPRLSAAGGDVVFRDPAMLALKRTLLRVASAPVNVLVLGETGVGKDVVASMLHELSSRAAKPFVRLNCASVPETLLESELFGHERGAFTGAVSAKPGLLETAHSGTVLLDEIGEIPVAMQTKLLRVIESGELTRVGGVQPRPIDVRFVAATNRDLAADVETGRFRRDLFYRLNTVTLTVPPLRDRVPDIEPLARLFLGRACQRFGVSGLALSAASVAALNQHDWPGNVRELKNVVERAALLAPDSAIEPAHLGLDRAARSAPPPAPAVAGLPPSERDRIESALVASGWNQTRAAKLLGMPRRTLVRKLARLDLPRPRSNSA